MAAVCASQSEWVRGREGKRKIGEALRRERGIWTHDVGCDRSDPQDTKAASAGWYMCMMERDRHLAVFQQM